MIIDYLKRCKNIERLGLYYKIRSYNLLEHQYMTAMLFRQFASLEDVSYSMQEFDLVLCHDIVETVTMDLSYEVKNVTPEAKEAWDTIEKAVTKLHPRLDRYSDTNLKSGLNERQHKLFKSCDLLDLFIFCIDEYKLGNRSEDIQRVLENCRKLIPAYGFPHVIEYMRKIDIIDKNEEN